MIHANNLGAVVVDASVLVALCAKEKDKAATAETALSNYNSQGWSFYAPGVVISETLFALCWKLQNSVLTENGHQIAIRSFIAYMSMILPPPNGDTSLIVRAEEIRSGYGCSRSADGLYIALAEELSQVRTAELLTFDVGLSKQAARNAPTVKVNLLPC
ncbi:MAG: type II toxin-antitoxin system VapC family toxin [Blastocatellia bacterium]